MKDFKLISSLSQKEHEQKLDELTKENYTDIPLILLASGNALRYEYAGFTVRKWTVGKNCYYDTCVK